MKKTLLVLCFFSFFLTAFNEVTPLKSFKIRCEPTGSEFCSMTFDTKDKSLQCNCSNGKMTIGQIDGTDDLSVVLPYLEYFKTHIQEEYQVENIDVRSIEVSYSVNQKIVDIQYFSPKTNELTHVLYSTFNENDEEHTVALTCLSNNDGETCLVDHDTKTGKIKCSCENSKMRTEKVK